MSYFTKRIYCRQLGFLEFSFNGIDTTAGIKFHVTVHNEAGTHFHFAMQESRGGWEIINAPLPPEWIVCLETKLSEAIKQQVKELVE